MYGYSPIDFEADVVANTWTAFWASEPEPLYLAELTYYIDTGCLTRTGFDIEWVPEYPPPGGGVLISGIGSIGTPESCENINFPTATGTFTINGEGEFPYYYFTGLNESTGQNYLFLPPPDLVFT